MCVCVCVGGGFSIRCCDELPLVNQYFYNTGLFPGSLLTQCKTRGRNEPEVRV